jgi:hypothetical protein
VDCHNEQYFLTGNAWHLKQSELLRQYVRGLKDWIREEEKKMVEIKKYIMNVVDIIVQLKKGGGKRYISDIYFKDRTS